VAAALLADLGLELLVHLSVQLGPHEGGGTGKGVPGEVGTVGLGNVPDGLVDGAETSLVGRGDEGLVGVDGLGALLGHHNNSLLGGADVQDLLVDESVGTERVHIAEVVGLAGKSEAVLLVLHEEGRVVPDEHPLKRGRHDWWEKKKKLEFNPQIIIQSNPIRISIRRGYSNSQESGQRK